MINKKVIIAITMGDPAGIGPEIILRYFQEIGRRESLPFYPLIIGDLEILQEVNRRLAIIPQETFQPIATMGEAIFNPGKIKVLDLRAISIEKVSIGQAGAACGQASIAYIEKAIDLCLAGEIQAMVTAPINKEAIHLAGINFPGHTELLAKKTNTPDYAMMLAGGKLRVVLVTTHLALTKVSSQITCERVFGTISIAHRWLQRYYPQETSLAVCGLNPHAGEKGLFGQEEIEAIIPAVEQAQAEGIKVVGPLPADTLFYKAQTGAYGAVVVMYHDQGLIPLKMLAFETGVNITLGLPIIRTSVDHGTAYDLAWQGRASHASLATAVKTAWHLAKAKAEPKDSTTPMVKN